MALALVGLSQWRTQPLPAAVADPAQAAQPQLANAAQVAQFVSQLPLPATEPASAPAQAGSAPEVAAPGAALRALPVARPVAPAKVDKKAAKDPDAELVAAVMAHSDAAQRQAPPKPLSDVQRFQFAMELRRCKGQPNQTTQDACVVAACESRAYWGRTRSCPMPPEPRSLRSRAELAVPAGRG